MTTDQRKQQKHLPFDDTKEQQRLERVERLLATDKRITTADKIPYFDYAEATMATLPLHKCTHPGCRQLVRGSSRCEQHTKESKQQSGKNRPGDPFYSSKAWLKVRNQRRLMNPLCQQCEKQGKVRAMHAVDHIKPRGEWPELELDIVNTQSLCEHCHNSWKQSEERSVSK